MKKALRSLRRNKDGKRFSSVTDSHTDGKDGLKEQGLNSISPESHQEASPKQGEGQLEKNTQPSPPILPEAQNVKDIPLVVQHDGSRKPSHELNGQDGSQKSADSRLSGRDISVAHQTPPSSDQDDTATTITLLDNNDISVNAISKPVTRDQGQVHDDTSDKQGPSLAQAPPAEPRAANNPPGARVAHTSKKIILNAFVEMCSGHQSPGLWRHPDDESRRFNEVKYWMDLAKLLEAGKFHGIFIADVLGGYDIYGGPRNLKPAVISGAQWPVNEPLAVVPAMAAVTESIGIGVTVSTTYEQPYHLARRLSTVDHLTNGRLGWNVVTGYLDSAARNLGHSEQPEHDERYRICEEYMEVVYKLWQSSWREGSIIHDAKASVYTQPDGVREINHTGKYFQVPGPHICQPSPQRTPVIMQAGTSKSGKAFAARHAEAIFVSNHSPAASAKAVADIRAQAAREGRDPRSIKVLAKICPVIGRTQEEAEAKYRDYMQYGSEEGALALFGGWTGVDMSKYGDEEELRYVESNAIRSYIEGLVKYGPKLGKWTKKTVAEHIIVGGLGATPIGTVEHVADEFERWIEEADVDGFNIVRPREKLAQASLSTDEAQAYAIMPQTFVDVIELLLPELRRRGIFWDDYDVPGGTYRENLTGIEGYKYPGDNHPAAKYLWTADAEVSTAQSAPQDEADDALDPMSMQFG